MYTRSGSAVRLAVVAGLLAVAVSACQSAIRGQGATSTSPTSTAARSSATPTQASSPPRRPTRSPSSTRTISHPPTASLPIETPTPTTSPTSGGAAQTLIGTAYQGAEPGCIGLRVGTASYELTGSPVSKLPQDGYGQTLGRVRVVGHLAPPTLASRCMIGRIFDVSALTRL